MPCAAAMSSAGTPARLEITMLTRAGSSPRSMASRIARRLLPRPETSTPSVGSRCPSTAAVSSLPAPDSGSAIQPLHQHHRLTLAPRAHHADHTRAVSLSLDRVGEPQRRRDIRRAAERHEADAQVEDAPHLIPAYAARALNKSED